jgi:uncharacterized protein (PEP-CTERM system associated)
MRTSNINLLTRVGLKNALMAGAGAGIFVSVAIAQVPNTDAPLKLRTDYLGYAASVSTRFSYTDNINLQRDALADDEYIFSTQLTGGAIVSTPRVTGIILGDLDFSFLADRSDLVVNQNIGATGTFTAADNFLYVDISGQTSRQLIGDNARFSSNINAARGQRANVNSYTASPYIYHRMANQSAVELRYRWSQIFVDDSNTDFNPTGGSFLNDSRSHEVLASYESGNSFDVFRFRTTVYGIDTVDDGSTIFPVPFQYRQGSIFTEAQLALNRKFSLSGAVGYDEVETDQAAALFFDENALSGLFWRAGFTAKPGRRARIRLEYGKRYDDDFIDAQMSYELSNRFVFTAGASRTFQTRAQTVSGQFRANQRQTLDFADRLREGQQISPRAVIRAANRFAGVSGGNAQTIGLGTSNTAYAALNGAFDRTNVSVSGNYSDTNFGFRQIETYGVSFNARRRLSRRLDGFGSVNWRRTDTAIDTTSCLSEPRVFGFDTTDPLFNPVVECAGLAVNSGLTNTLSGSVGAAYRVYENVSAYIQGSRTERFSPNPILEYNENTVAVGITLDL